MLDFDWSLLGNRIDVIIVMNNNSRIRPGQSEMSRLHVDFGKGRVGLGSCFVAHNL